MTVEPFCFIMACLEHTRSQPCYSQQLQTLSEMLFTSMTRKAAVTVMHRYLRVDLFFVLDELSDFAHGNGLALISQRETTKLRIVFEPLDTNFATSAGNS